MSSRLLLVLLSPFLAYGATMGYLWYQVRDSTENLIKAAAPFATVSYDGIHISPLGDEIGLDGLSIQPTMTADSFRIDALRLSVPHIGYFLDAKRSMESKKLPERMGVEISRLHLDLGSELFDFVAQAQQAGSANQQRGMVSFITQLDAAGCGSKQAFELQDYRNMGMGAVVANIKLAIENDHQAQHGRVNMAGSLEGLYEIDSRVEMDTSAAAMSAMSAGRVPKSTIRYRDTGLYELRNDYCAGQNDGTVEEYVERHIAELSATLGSSIPEEATHAYRNYMLHGGEILLQFDPTTDLDPNALAYYKPADIVSMLGMEITVGGERVALEEFDWVSPKSKRTVKRPAQDGTASQGEPAKRPVVESDNAPLKIESYKDVSLSDAAKHLTRMAEVTTVDGRVRRGTLSKVSDGRLVLVMKFSAGELTYPVETRLIERLRVRY